MITNSICVLLAFASPPRMRNLFFRNKDPEIVTVENTKQPIDLPPSLEILKSVAAAALRSQGEDLIPVADQFPPRAISKVYGDSSPGTGPSYLQPVHWECALILHLVSRWGLEKPPLSCIGVSKLSCFSCWELIRCIQECCQVKYHVRGTHGKVYFPWKYPINEITASLSKETGDNIRAQFSEKVANKYTNCVLASRHEHSSLGLRENAPEYPDWKEVVQDALHGKIPSI